MTWSPAARAAIAACATAMTACSSVHVQRGLPIVAKSTNGHLVQGSGGPPDLERGNQARLAGRAEDAERDLLPLAQRGYPEAQMYLAAIYGERVSPEAQESAIEWYRKALRHRPEAAVPLARVLMHRGDRVSVLEAERLLINARHKRHEPSADGALLDLYGLYPQFDSKRQAPELARTASRSMLPDLRIAAIGWYRASLGEAGNAQRLMELCRSNLDVEPSCYIDLALYYRYAQQRKPLEELIRRALASWEKPPSIAEQSMSGLEPVELAPVASRLAVSMIDQPLDEITEDTADDDLELQNEMQAQVDIAAADEDADARLDEPSRDNMPAASARAPAPMQANTLAADRAQPGPIPANAQPPTAQPANALPELADKILRWMLKQSGAMPTEAAGVAVSYPYLLPDVDLEKVLKEGVAANVPRASLFLGQLYYFNQRAPRNALLGEESLRRALLFRETSIPGHYRLGRLYQQGYLGRPDPQQALDNFLYAARRRVTAADAHLARLFYDTPGAKINRVNAYVFARLSQDGGMPVVIRTLHGGQLNSYPLLDRLRTDLTEDELRRAEQLYQQECEVHLVMRAAVSPQAWVKAVHP